MNNSESEETGFRCLIDCHVHFYECYPAENFFDSAVSNLKKLKGQSSILSDLNFYGLTIYQRKSEDLEQRIHLLAELGSWRLTSKSKKFFVFEKESDHLIVMLGRQIVTTDDLEVLVLGYSGDLPSDRGLDCRSLVSLVLSNLDTICIVPWSPGKWFFKRGKTVFDTALEFAANKNFKLGDIKIRSRIFKKPKVFDIKPNIVLAGSDPLPIAEDFKQVGTYASLISIKTADTADIILGLKKGGPSFGKKDTILKSSLRWIKSNFAGRKKITHQI